MFPIPANATRIRYLQSDGSANIKMLLPVDLSAGYAAMLVDMEFVSAPTDTAGCGYYSSTNRFFAGRIASGSTYEKLAFRVIKKDCYSTTTSDTARHRYYADTQTGAVTFDGSSIAASGTSGTITVPAVGVFGRTYDAGTGWQAYGTPMRVYSFKFWKDGVLIYDLVPVRVGTTGAMFNRATGETINNQSTGDFVLGPDTFSQGVIPTRMMPMGVRKKEVWPIPLYTGVNLVGSSVQNNNGILSGFTGSSYATMPFYWTSGASQIEAVIKIHFAQGAPGGSGQGIWGCVGSANAFTPFFYNGPSGPLGSYLSTTGSGGWHASPNGEAESKRVAWDNSSPLAAGDYILREVYENSTVKTGRWSNGAWTTETSNSLGTIYGASDLVPQLGTNRGQNSPFLGTIDLNYTYLMRDGELWWEGAAGAYKNVKTTYPD